MSRVRQLCSVGLGGAVLVASVPVLLFGFSPTGQANARDEGGHCGRLEGYNHTSASCEIFGGCHTFCPRNKCQCTSQCINIGNCCHDYVQYCVNKKHSDFELLQAEMKLERMEREGGIIGTEWIFSLAMIFFIFTMILLIFLVNSKHTSIQHSVYRVMCTTVSIFAASTSSVAVHGIVIEQLWQGKQPGLHQSAGPLVQARIYLVLTLLFYLFSNWCTHYYFRLKQEVFAVAELMSHMTGFMLIRLVGSLQQTVRESELKALTVVLVVFVLLRVVVDLAEWAREKFAATDAWHWQFALSGSGQWNDLSHLQSRRLEELRVQQAPGEPDSDYTLLRPISVLLEAEDDMEDPDPLARFGPMRCALSSPSFCAGEMRRDEEKEGSSQSWQLRRHSHWDEAMQTGTIEGAALAIGFLVLLSAKRAPTRCSPVCLASFYLVSFFSSSFCLASTVFWSKCFPFFVCLAFV
ncbi:unnamed protein product [Effrenium voratum]|uniref:SMB domain-containing protein n=1 Tax=Effrenium voratum TaxID=2562239 RepID=A0AA36I1H5_9DINO|nr:unnamed protein product [Effrenium voratum]CAJ1460151.1 unnamed protein product [Effrenium voratum]